MAQLELTPVPSRWALMLLLLLSGEPVPANKMANSAGKTGFFKGTGSSCSRIWQNPRFMAKKHGSKVEIRCYADGSNPVEWLWKQEWDQEPKPLLLGERFQTHKNSTVHTLTIKRLLTQDNGFYFCRQTCLSKDASHSEPLTACATELRVMGFSTIAQLRRRNMLKDGIIMIQTLLIIVLIIVPIFLLLDKDDGKSGMEEDHTYEGLNIDQTATYEDIVTLRTGEVKWSVGEHPGQE